MTFCRHTRVTFGRSGRSGVFETANIWTPINVRGLESFYRDVVQAEANVDDLKLTEDNVAAGG